MDKRLNHSVHIARITQVVETDRLKLTLGVGFLKILVRINLVVGRTFCQSCLQLSYNIVHIVLDFDRRSGQSPPFLELNRLRPDACYLILLLDLGY